MNEILEKQKYRILAKLERLDRYEFDTIERLSKAQNITTDEIIPALKNLEREGMIKKECVSFVNKHLVGKNDNGYTLSELGRGMMKLYPTLNEYLKNKK
jgi:predicted transcriptional regulator